VGVMGTLYVAAALNLLVAFGGWLLSRFSEVGDDAAVAAAGLERRKAAPVGGTDFRFYLLVVAFFMSGLICIGYELIWMRSIVPLVGGFTYVFSAVLTVYLLGNVIGAGIGSRLAARLEIPAVFVGFSFFFYRCSARRMPISVLGAQHHHGDRFSHRSTGVGEARAQGRAVHGNRLRGEHHRGSGRRHGHRVCSHSVIGCAGFYSYARFAGSMDCGGHVVCIRVALKGRGPVGGHRCGRFFDDINN